MWTDRRTDMRKIIGAFASLLKLLNTVNIIFTLVNK